MKSSSFSPPPVALMERILRIQKWYFSPVLRGAENVDAQRPALFVGNHGLYGLIDSPLFVLELYRQTGVFPRALGDRLHFDVPGWGKLLTRWGAVEGTPANCTQLMESGQHVLVFPGGAREVAMRKDEIHKLVWKQRTGFARMAIQHGYDIIPFASAGCDMTYKILYDSQDFKRSRLGKWLLKRKPVDNLLRDGDTFMPLSRGLGPTLLPKPEPLWFQIGKPIPSTDYAGKEGDKNACWDLRDKVSASIESMLADLEEQRAGARRRGVRKWLLK